MADPIVTESLDINGWTPEQQDNVLNELLTIKGLSLSQEPASLTDPELTALLVAVTSEMRVRPAAVITGQDRIDFDGNTVVVPQT